MRKHDFRVQNEGSILILFPETKRAKAWTDENLPPDVMTWCHGIVVEHRFISDIVDGILRDGLTVKGGNQ